MENSTQKKGFHEFDDIAINKTAKIAIIENLIPELIQVLGTIYKKFREA
jgi:hypothetical protein